MRPPGAMTAIFPPALLAAMVLAFAHGGMAPAAAGEAALHDRMLARINLHRARNDLPPLAMDARLAGAALAHARDMVQNDFFGHAGSDQADIARRVGRTGYSWHAVGENIAGGLASPEDTVDGWMASPGHRRNMLNAVFRDAGIGHVFRADDGGAVRYRHYWTLVLAAGPAPPR